MLNSCEFIGNLGADPEVRTFQNGDKVCNLRIAVTEKWKDKNTGEKREATEWVSIAVFGNLVRICEQYLRKGSKVFVRGKMKTRKWQDQSGADRYSTEIVLQGFDAKLVMLSPADSGGSQSGQGGGYGGGYGGGQGGGYDRGPQGDPYGGGNQGGGRGPASRDIDDDEIPF